MASGLVHLIINLIIISIFIFFVIDFLPDVDHFRLKDIFKLKIKDLYNSYFGKVCCIAERGSMCLHNPIYPIIMFLISIMWLIHLYFDRIFGGI